MLYQTYLKLFKRKKILLGLSYRLPDYANRYWLERLERAILDVPQKIRFLDIGAGSGRFSIIFLKTYFKEGTAIEAMPDKFIWNEITQEFENLRLIENDAQKALADIAKKKYDFILLSESFEHIPLSDVSIFIKNLKNVLSEDGRLFLTTPNFYVQGSAENSPYWHEILPYGHYKHYKFQEIKEIFEAQGFEVVWNCFESHYIKTNIYNNLFYPLSRLDFSLIQKLKTSARIPQGLRFICWIYLCVSYPMVIVVNFFAWLISQLIFIIEKYFNSEKVSATSMVLFKLSNRDEE